MFSIEHFCDSPPGCHWNIWFFTKTSSYQTQLYPLTQVRGTTTRPENYSDLGPTMPIRAPYVRKGAQKSYASIESVSMKSSFHFTLCSVWSVVNTCIFDLQKTLAKTSAIRYSTFNCLYVRILTVRRGVINAHFARWRRIWRRIGFVGPLVDSAKQRSELFGE